MMLLAYRQCEHGHYGPHALDDAEPVLKDGENLCRGGTDPAAPTLDDVVAWLTEQGVEVHEDEGGTYLKLPETA